MKLQEDFLRVIAERLQVYKRHLRSNGEAPSDNGKSSSEDSANLPTWCGGWDLNPGSSPNFQ
jgi:hypothetical protein